MFFFLPQTPAQGQRCSGLAQPQPGRHPSRPNQLTATNWRDRGWPAPALPGSLLPPDPRLPPTSSWVGTLAARLVTMAASLRGLASLYTSLSWRKRYFRVCLKLHLYSCSACICNVCVCVCMCGCMGVFLCLCKHSGLLKKRHHNLFTIIVIIKVSFTWGLFMARSKGWR